MVMYKKLIILSFCVSIVKVSVGEMLLNMSSISWMLVVVSLYSINTSSTYLKYPTSLCFTRMSKILACSSYCI